MSSGNPGNYPSFTGVVLRKLRGQYLVQSNDRLVTCALSSRLYKKLIYPTAAPSSLSHIVRSVEEIDMVDPVAIGDQVIWIDPGDGNGLVTELLPRKSQLSRADFNQTPTHKEQIIVANIDQVVAVFAAARPAPSWGLLDRFLITAEIYQLPALICITKIDLADMGDIQDTLDIYTKLGYPLIVTSSFTGVGIDDFKTMIENKISLLIGKSGVGKTSLLNALVPGLGLKVKEVGTGNLGKGKHTTTHLEMFPLLGGGLIDTPGMRIFSLWNLNGRELAWYFREMRPLLGNCRFGASCAHDTEPGCAIRNAVSNGSISPSRYSSYLKLFEEME
jgi:ribosome biogenesis GTPase